ncbi:potassium channel family protein [Hutsoniella sourekii]|uniref:potassium channel family protein n=1 Tax=Hutsoniella sourekii TaxID=87650 RepID=UPI0004819296|nr:TrkA family potassium uptake protein [Hutsoniella sourekii]
MNKKRIIGILGLGLFGAALARRLSSYGLEVIGCDIMADHVNELDDCLTIGAIGNFTDLDFMRETGFSNCDVIVIGTGANLEAAILGVLNAQELQVPKIICKTKDQRSAKALRALGVDHVILPEQEMGHHLGDILSRQTIEDMINLDDETAIVEFQVPDQWLGREIDELDLRNKYDLNIIGLRKKRGEALNTNFGFNYTFQAGDLIVAVSNIATFDKVDYLERL